MRGRLGRFGLTMTAFSAVLSIAACNTDPAVFVDAEVVQPTLAVDPGVLGASVSGGFVLSLHLGARASGPSEVTLGALSVVDASGNVVYEPLPATPSESSPITVEPDSTVEITFAVDSGAEPVSDAVLQALCAGNVAIRVVLEDSLESGSSPIDSEPFAVVGCAK
jgi:hypothetical protein